MKAVKTSTIIHSAIAVLALLLILTNVYIVQSVDVFGSPLLFAFSVLAELILIIVLMYSLIRALTTPLRIISSILKSAWAGILTNPYIKRIRKTKLPFSKWLVARIDRTNPFGLVLTIGVAISILFFIAFNGVLKEVWVHGTLTKFDTRVVNLMPSIRTPFQTSYFRFFTFLANSETIILFSLMSCLILWLKRQRAAIGLLLFALVAEESTAFVLKRLVGRMRPEQSLALLNEYSFSFPSGHVLRATVIFGLLAYLLHRSFKSSTLRLGIIIVYLITVTLVALSRVYFGVHYPSDVLASILIGASLLTLLISAVEIVTRYKLYRLSPKDFSNKLLAIVPAAIILVSLIASQKLIKISSVTTIPTFKTLSSISIDTVGKLPLYSETLTGKKMEPINFIYTGSEQQIEVLFLSHGWYKADPSTLSNTLKALSVGFQGHQYLNAPVTPSYLAAKPENLAFQKPTDSNTLRQRHHTRLWRTDYNTIGGQEIWVGTASYDEGIEFAGPAKLPTHHIDPNVDDERAFLVTSLGVKDVISLRVVRPQAGKNASGDVFFTDGKAVYIKL